MLAETRHRLFACRELASLLEVYGSVDDLDQFLERRPGDEPLETPDAGPPPVSSSPGTTDQPRESVDGCSESYGAFPIAFTVVSGPTQDESQVAAAGADTSGTSDEAFPLISVRVAPTVGGERFAAHLASTLRAHGYSVLIECDSAPTSLSDAFLPSEEAPVDPDADVHPVVRDVWRALPMHGTYPVDRVVFASGRSVGEVRAALGELLVRRMAVKDGECWRRT